MRRATVDCSLLSSSNETLPFAVSGRSAAPGVGAAGAAAGAAAGGGAGPAAPLTARLDDPPAGPRPGEPGQIEPALTGDAASKGRRLDAPIAGRSWGLRRG